MREEIGGGTEAGRTGAATERGGGKEPAGSEK